MSIPAMEWVVCGVVRHMHSLIRMKSQEAGTDNGSTERTGAHANGTSRIHWRDVARRAKDSVSGFPANLGDRMKNDPYKTLGLAAAAGIGVGIVLGSRILRTVLTGTVSYAVVELARAYVRERMQRPDGAPVVMG
jgi:hypothetical protein